METKQEETKFSIHKNPQHASKLFVFHTRRSFALRIKKARKIPPVEKKKKKKVFLHWIVFPPFQHEWSVTGISLYVVLKLAPSERHLSAYI